MSGSPHPRPRRRLLSRPKFWLYFVVVGVVLGVATWFATPSIYRRMLSAFMNVDNSAVRIEVDGRVVDADGQPVFFARVHGAWEVFVPGETKSHGSGSFNERANEHGDYRHIQWFSTDQLAVAPELEVRLTVQAHGRFDECEPSEARTTTLPGRSHSTHDFRLGPALPSVPVHVVDSQGQPVTVFWVRAMSPEDGQPDDGAESWPERYKDFPDGIAELAVPPRPFRVRVHMMGGKRKATVGPFDPDAMPARIDVTLPDR